MIPIGLWVEWEGERVIGNVVLSGENIQCTSIWRIRMCSNSKCVLSFQCALNDFMSTWIYPGCNESDIPKKVSFYEIIGSSLPKNVGKSNQKKTKNPIVFPILSSRKISIRELYHINSCYWLHCSLRNFMVQVKVEHYTTFYIFFWTNSASLSTSFPSCRTKTSSI